MVTSQTETTRPFLGRILHPSDFSPGSEFAFAHALKLALTNRGELRIIHVAPNSVEVPWKDFPGVRSTLARWDILPEGSSKDAIARVGLRVRKILASGADPVEFIAGYLEDKPADLVVLAAHQREGLAAWLDEKVAEPIARRSKTMTLFVPTGIQGFISLADGSVALKRILIPVDSWPHPKSAVQAAAELAVALGCDEVSFTLVHVASRQGTPLVNEPHREGWTWNSIVRRGNVVEEILEVGATVSADLIVMTTEGRHGFLDALRGSTSERILRHARCPLLAIPAVRPPLRIVTKPQSDPAHETDRT